MYRDAPRQTERRQRKAQGFPASEDVERLADMMSALLYRAEEFLGHKVTSTLAATPDLVALYCEDLEDAFDYIEVKSLDEPNGLFRLFRETAAVQGHYGFGLCEKPFQPAACLDEIRKMNSTDVLTIFYTRRSLCLEVCVMNSAYSIYPYPSVPTSMDFTLGSDAIREGPNDDYYWEAVRERIVRAIAAALPYRKPTRVFLMGESIDSARLRQILSDTLVEMLSYMPDVYADDPVFAASSGAAEFARRGGYRWNARDPVLVS